MQASQFADFYGGASFMGAMFQRPPTVFEGSFRCYSFAMCGREALEEGDKSKRMRCQVSSLTLFVFMIASFLHFPMQFYSLIPPSIH